MGNGCHWPLQWWKPWYFHLPRSLNFRTVHYKISHSKLSVLTHLDVLVGPSNISYSWFHSVCSLWKATVDIFPNEINAFPYAVLYLPGKEQLLGAPVLLMHGGENMPESQFRFWNQKSIFPKGFVLEDRKMPPMHWYSIQSLWWHAYTKTISEDKRLCSSLSHLK